MDKVLAKWLDPSINSGWEPVEKYKTKPHVCLCETLGYLLEETPDYLVIAFTVADTDANGVLILPRPALVSLERLG